MSGARNQALRDRIETLEAMNTELHRQVEVLADRDAEIERLKLVEAEARGLLSMVRAEHNGWDSWCDSFKRRVMRFLGYEKDRAALSQPCDECAPEFDCFREPNRCRKLK